jgi:hypothetical protein
MVVRIGSLIAGFISALRKILARRSRLSYLDNGVYVWDKGSFNRVYIDDPGSLFNRATHYLIYFHNNMCPACKRFYPLLLSILSRFWERLENIVIIGVVCDWFASRCRDRVAASLFKAFKVSASPSLILVEIDHTGSPRLLADLTEDIGSIASREGDPAEALISLIREKIRAGSSDKAR